MVTFRFQGFTSIPENKVAEKAATVYFTEGVNFLMRAFGLDIHWTTQTRVDGEDGEIECIIKVDGVDEDKALKLFEQLEVERSDKFTI